MPLPEERLDGIVDVILRVDSTCQHLLVIPQMLMQDIDEVSAAVR